MVMVQRLYRAVLGLGLHGGAILAEVFRSGIEALHKGQREAALALGMTPSKAMTYIILPQAMRIVLPTSRQLCDWTSQGHVACTLIGVNEIMNGAKSIAFRNISRWRVHPVAAIYFVMSYPLSLLVRHMERRLSISR